jgi:hypothetical protein
MLEEEDLPYTSASVGWTQFGEKENGYRGIVWIKLIPDLDQIRSEPRFQKLMEEYFGRFSELCVAFEGLSS